MMRQWFALLCLPGIAQAGPLGLSGSTGMEFPLAHHDTFSPGVVATLSWRKDPYELRFHFSDMDIRQFAVVMTIKHFFSDEALRPFVEGGVGPLIMDPPNRGLAYGVRPEVALGADLGLNKYLSFGAAVRYGALVYFGDTDAGNFEANHALSITGNATLWF